MNIFSYEPMSLPPSRVRIFPLGVLSVPPTIMTTLGSVVFVLPGVVELGLSLVLL
jgi:hypothetical protein